MFGHGLWCCPSSVGCLWCSWLGFVFGLPVRRVWFRARPACPLPFLVPACGVGVRAGPGSRLCPAFLGLVVGVCFLLFFLLLGFPVPGLVVPVPPSPFFRAGLLALFFHIFLWRVSACFGVPFPGGPLFLAWCCQFWLGGPPVPLLGVLSSVPSRGGRFDRLWWCWRAVSWLWAVFAPPPLPPFLVFFFGGGAACSSLCLPWAGARTGPHSVLSSGLLLAVVFCLAVFRPHGSGGLCTRWARRPFLPG